MPGRLITLSVWFFLLSTSAGAAADGMTMAGDFGNYPMGRDGSGTSWVPDATPMDGLHSISGDWMLMLDGSLALADTQQSGPRGASATYSQSMLMGAARRDLGDSTLTLRAMVSADPVNGAAGYPLLFQTGETANGRDPLVDRQHPHNLFMEIAAAYSRTLSDVASLFVYAAPVGEPALGPPAFPHRRTDDPNPEAPLSHHHIDSTHISFGVLTTGLISGHWKLEGSAFNGREPDQHRSALELRRLDSWSTRLSFNPGSDLALQVSTGRLASPEGLHPSVSVVRTTASVLHEHRLGAVVASTTLAFGRNKPSEGRPTDAWLLSEALRIGPRQTLYARFERVGYDELPSINDLTQSPIIRKGSLGYQVDFAQWGPLHFEGGAVASRYWIPPAISAVYGLSPDSWTLYLRARIAP